MSCAKNGITVSEHEIILGSTYAGDVNDIELGVESMNMGKRQHS